ncbi:MAG: hypothetical protein JST89_16885 [Cyanobacteria bacterium SZAS-4]|nr:hypothetical protein [Cyanobacteria bacterium SZAS-4]
MRRELESFVPAFDSINSDLIHTFDAKADSIETLLDVINQVHKLHFSSIWILGATIVSPQGQTVLISGPLSSGKSTTVLGLVFNYGWKVISEDITHIDMTTNEIINFASPFAIKPGTFDLLKTTFQPDKFPDPSTVWMALNDKNLGCNRKAGIDLVIHFDKPRGGAISLEKISVPEYIRAILQKSNIALVNGAADKICEYVSEDSCYLIKDGSLKERIQTILQLCDAKAPLNNGDLTL